MSAHTPGPWKIRTEPDADGNPVTVIRADARAGAIAYCPVGYCSDGSEEEADLRLAAAAPDGLEAAKAALVNMREMHEAAQAGRPVLLDRGAFDALEAFIAKATGGK